MLTLLTAHLDLEKPFDLDRDYLRRFL